MIYILTLLILPWHDLCNYPARIEQYEYHTINETIDSLNGKTDLWKSLRSISRPVAYRMDSCDVWLDNCDDIATTAKKIITEEGL